MKLRKKMFIVISLAWIVFLVITYIGSQTFLLHSFLELEKVKADEDLYRLDQILDQKNNSLYTFTSDWSHWNDLYDYMQGKNPSFVPNNLNMTAFQNSTINMLTYWDLDDHLKVGTAIDTDKGKIVAYPKGIEKYVYPNSLLLDRKDVENDIRGYILLPSGVMFIAAVAVTDGDKVQPSLGAMVNARYLSPKIIQQIEEELKLGVDLFLPEQIEKNPSLKKMFNIITRNNTGHTSQSIDEENLEGYTLLHDIYGKPIAMLSIHSPRSIYQTGLKAIHYYLITFVIVGIIFTMLLTWLLRKLIIRRLERLDSDVHQISHQGNLANRVDSKGNDEISSLGGQINSMIHTIQTSHEQLEHRVQERTQELQKINVQLEQEIRERKSIEEDLIRHKEYLVQLAHYDELTSLPNRIFFNEILNKVIMTSKENNTQFALFFIDLDRFKKINDALGHSTGDLVLKEFANNFKATINEDDILARLGGDEFVMLLNNITDLNSVNAAADKILEICSKPIRIKGHEFYIATSIGICLYPKDGNSLEDLLKNADMAMYKAKRVGGSVYRYFTEEMNLEANEYIELETKLRRAVANKEFVLYYQPKYTVKDLKICGVEALIRWEDPELGLIHPEKFIPLAEETGLILQIGEWVLREACRETKSWQDRGFQPIPTAVNVSAKQFRHQNLALLVESILKETKLDAKYLEIEITETAVMDNVEAAITKLHDIKIMGVNVSIDDFGTGYTSINHLKQFPINILKIDKSFIDGVPQSKNDSAIISGIIALAHSLGLEVIAEGVQTAEQLLFLAEQGCDIVQGYYLSKPEPSNNIIQEFSRIAEPSREVF